MLFCSFTLIIYFFMLLLFPQHSIECRRNANSNSYCQYRTPFRVIWRYSLDNIVGFSIDRESPGRSRFSNVFPSAHFLTTEGEKIYVVLSSLSEIPEREVDEFIRNKNASLLQIKENVLVFSILINIMLLTFICCIFLLPA